MTQRPPAWSATVVTVLCCTLFAPAPGNAAPPPADPLELRTRSAAALLTKAACYQPTKVRFTVAKLPLSVVIEKVDFHGGRKVLSADYAARPEGVPRQSVTTASLKGVGRRVLWTDVSDDGPEVRFLLAAPQGDRGELVLHVRGADRIVAGGDGTYAARPIAPDAGPIGLAGRQLVCQSRRDQHGVLISVSANDPAGKIRVAPAQGGLTVHVPWHAVRSTPDPAVSIVVQGIRGDATIALEGAPDAAAAGQARPDPPRALTEVAGLLGPADRQARTAPPKPRDDSGPPGGRTEASREPGAGVWEFWTGTDRAFAPLLADPREATARIAFLYERGGGKFMDAALGGDLVIAERRFAPDRRFSLSLRGLVTARLNTCEESFPLYNADFFGGLAAGYRHGDDAFELYLFHESSHLGDEILEQGLRRRIDYSREAVRLLWAHRFGPVRVYGGPTFNFRAWPADIRCRTTLQLGGEWRFRVGGVPTYLAADLQSKQENDWCVNVTTQGGIELGDPAKSKKRPRVFLELFNGYSNMGQFFDDRETYLMLGLGYDF
ncbi:MAG TPA: DUF1207 domain-containing protein [Phycisphaerae bacterium]|nr:DUF1207 domain-containing protein [Phycisphaerae bacterium]